MQIEKAMAKFCMAKGIEVTSDRIKVQADYLRNSKYTDSQIMEALGQLFGETPFFPDASMILNKLKPSKQDYEIEANLISGKIIEAISSLGPYRTDDVKEFVGAVGWHVVERFGGWQSLCQITYDEIATVRAQLRRLAESVVRSKHCGGLEYAQSEQIEIKKKETGLVLLKGG